MIFIEQRKFYYGGVAALFFSIKSKFLNFQRKFEHLHKIGAENKIAQVQAQKRKEEFTLFFVKNKGRVRPSTKLARQTKSQKFYTWCK